MNILISVLNFIKIIFTKPREVLIGLLIIALCLFIVTSKIKDKKINDLTTQLSQLPPGTTQIVTVYQDKIKILEKTVDGKVVYRDRYLPPEGYIMITAKEQEEALKKYEDLIKRLLTVTDLEELKKIQIELSSMTALLQTPPTVDIHDWGFTFKSGIGSVYIPRDEAMHTFLDFKFFFWRRYSLTTFIEKEGIGLGITRHIDDVFPSLISPKNV